MVNFSRVVAGKVDSEIMLSGEEIFAQKMAWYAEDAGQQTLEEVIAILESAVQGDTRCGKQ